MKLLIILLGICFFIAALAYVSTCVVVAHIMTRAKRLDPMRNPIWDRHRADRVSLQPRGSLLRLAAWYLPCDGASRAIILVHGKDCCRGEELNTSTYALTERLRAAGLSVFMLDLRGHGESEFSRLTYGLRERYDVLGALDWLVAKGFEPKHIGLFGASMGGACALGAAAQARLQDCTFGAIVTDSTYADFDDMMRRKFRKLSGMPNMFLPGALAIGQLALRENFKSNKPEQDAASLLGMPMLVIHSQGDQFVPVDHATRLALSGGGKLWITQTERHMASFHVLQEEYLMRVVGFFIDSLGVARLRRVA
jgi:uncharacterized protein